MELKIKFVNHSIFTVETDKLFIVFDYYKGDIEFPQGKNIYFLNSHSHPDHFSEKVFKFQDVKKFILSDDIKDKGYENTVFISKDEIKDFDDFKLYTYGSTDEGVSFVIDIDGKIIFFAGDLNDWYWEMEDDEKQRDFMHNAFLKEIVKIKKHQIDVAFFPVDPRQEGQFDLGGKQVLEILKPKYFLPMHFWRKYETTDKFKEKYSKEFPNTEIFSIEKENQEFLLNI